MNATQSTTNDLPDLITAHERASTALAALLDEQDTITQQMQQAALSGDADRYCELKARRHELPDRIRIATLVHLEAQLARARVELAEVEAREEANPTVDRSRWQGNGDPVHVDVVAPLVERVMRLITAVDTVKKEILR